MYGVPATAASAQLHRPSLYDGPVREPRDHLMIFKSNTLDTKSVILSSSSPPRCLRGIIDTIYGIQSLTLLVIDLPFLHAFTSILRIFLSILGFPSLLPQLPCLLLEMSPQLFLLPLGFFFN